MSTLIVNADARDLSFLADDSVDLVVTSPPYPGQRDYRDGDASLAGQIGSEPHPRIHLATMWGVMRELWRVTKASGSVFVNYGDKRAGSGGPGGDYNAGGLRDGQPRAQQYRSHFGRPKSRQGIPERFVIGCEDGLADPDGVGWIWRQTIIIEKANGLPESVTDRTRDNFEYIYHFTKSERYYSAVDEIREDYSPKTFTTLKSGWGHAPADTEYARGKQAHWNDANGVSRADAMNPLGTLPGSVWQIASEPLRIPMHFVEDDRGWRVFGNPASSEKAKRKERELLWTYFEQRAREGCQWARYGEINHFAVFPSELPRRLILGWSPPAICLRCGEGRRPVVEKSYTAVADLQSGNGLTGRTEATIVGYACACTPFTDHAGSGKSPIPSGTNHAGRPQTETLSESDDGPRGGRVGPWREYHLDGWTPPPSRSAVVFDPFCGSGTTLGVAQALGRNAVGVELSSDYARLARWRIGQPSQWAKATARSWQEAQQVLL